MSFFLFVVFVGTLLVLWRRSRTNRDRPTETLPGVTGAVNGHELAILRRDPRSGKRV